MTNATTNNGRFFEDFSLNDVIVHATPRTVTEGDASLYLALTGSRHILHCAQPVAHSLGYQQQTVDDLLAFHIAFGKTVPDISVNAVANLGYAEVKFEHPIFAGDTLTTTSTVIGLKQNSSGKNGVVYVRSVATNQNLQTVISWVRWVMVHKNDHNVPAPETVTPELKKVVPVEELPVYAHLDAKDFDTHTTGSTRLWEDFVVGERLNHPAGMTIDASDHTLATKLYQNNARLHFDNLMMESSQFGQRLVYGGHIISLCRALSYDGLENALTIAAINAGTHSNPSFAGDTIYCWTEVIDKWAIPSREDVGALRLRMVGLKNQTPDSLSDSHLAIDGKRQYHPNVVLDLDYTVLMPRHTR
jgi:2-methylfumaryl-CoA hydratase